MYNVCQHCHAARSDTPTSCARFIVTAPSSKQVCHCCLAEENWGSCVLALDLSKAGCHHGSTTLCSLCILHETAHVCMSGLCARPFPEDRSKMAERTLFCKCVLWIGLALSGNLSLRLTHFSIFCQRMILDRQLSAAL